MGKKKSSFHMGNQFNGYGDTVYLKAEPVKAAPVSQEDVKLTPDYSKEALAAAGANPAVLNPGNMDEATQTMLGAQTSLNYVEVTKSGEGSCQAGFKIAAGGFADASYATYKPNSKPVRIDYRMCFSVTQTANLKIKTRRTTHDGALQNDGSRNSEYLIALIPSGQQILAVTENGDLACGRTEDDTDSYEWVKVMCIAEFDNEKGKKGEMVEGWAVRQYVREDGPREVLFNELFDYSNMAVIYTRLNDNKEIVEKRNVFDSWYTFQNRNSPDICRKTYGKWNVAVGPGVLDWEYPVYGECTAEEMKGFSKCIKVHLTLKDEYTSDPNKSQRQILECYVKDIKAHSFHRYPYRDSNKKKSLPPEHFISDFVSDASANVTCGLVQTGIRFPNASNGAVVALNMIDGSVIEFDGGRLTDFGFKLSDYSLNCVEVNYETQTRGEDMIQ